MLFVVSAFLTVTGLAFTYVAIGLVRAKERRRWTDDCERRIAILRRQAMRHE